jgi:hypothetical protein
MAKISTYATTAPALGDMLIGTDVNDMNSTKNFTIGSLLSLPGSTAYVPYTGALYNVNLGGNDITALGFIAIGGLGTDFLKADGSLDSTAYLPVSTAAATYVPYIGATGNVDLGTNRLTAKGLTTTTDDVEMIGLTPPSAINDYFEIGNWGWNGKSGLLIDFVNDKYFIGDRLSAVNGTYILVDDANSRVEISKSIYTNASTGTSGQILTSQGAGLPATWSTPTYLTPVYGSFYDVTNQTTLGAAFELMRFNSIDFSSFGVSIVNDGLGDPTEITFTVTGVYNIQFSAQLEKTGGTAATVYIYLVKNGTIVPNSNTAITLANNNHLVVAAWNFFVDISALPTYYQIGWYSTSADVQLHYDATPVVGLTSIPSVILTVNKVG